MMNVLSIPPIEINKRLFLLGRFDFITLHPTNGKNLKQELALQMLIDHITTELAYGGAAGGAKSWTGCAWLMFMCLLYPGVKGFVGRESLKDIRDSTLVTFHKVAKRYGLKPNEDYRYNGQDNFIYFPNESRIDLLNLEYAPSDPMYERLGSKEYTFGFLEECGQIHFNAFDVLKTRIGRHLNDKYGIKAKLFLTFNPKKNWLYSYFVKPPSGQLKPNQAFIKALVTDNTHRESDYEERLRSITDKVQRARLLEGNFDYEDDPAALIEYDKIIDLWSNTHVDEGPGYITCDAARFGGDKAKIAVWKGWRLIKWRVFPKSSMTLLADEIEKEMTLFGIPASNVVVDEDGVGGGIVDIFRDYKKKRIKGFVNNSAPLEEATPDGWQKPNYTNLKSQCSFGLASRINRGLMYVAPGIMTEEEKQLLVQELEQIKQKDMDKDGKKAVQPKEDVKKNIGRSPDGADTLMFRQYFELKPKPVAVTVF